MSSKRFFKFSFFLTNTALVLDRTRQHRVGFSLPSADQSLSFFRVVGKNPAFQLARISKSLCEFFYREAWCELHDEDQMSPIHMRVQQRRPLHRWNRIKVQRRFLRENRAIQIDILMGKFHIDTLIEFLVQPFWQLVESKQRLL